MISTNKDCCWRLVDAVGNEYDGGDGVQHYDREADAQRDAEARPGWTAQQFPEPCVEVSCTECETELETDVWTLHFVNQADAENGAEKSGWKVTEDGQHFCWDCDPEEAGESE